MTKQPRRIFSIGTEWLYYKIYTGHKTADLILTKCIKPVTEQLQIESIICKWFFIRYADPNHHLRIRFFTGDRDNLCRIISTLHDSLNYFIEHELIWKIQIDTYLREIERYGLNTIEPSEALFHWDSEATIQFLDLIKGEEGENLRWLFGLRSIDQLLNNFRYSPKEKMLLLRELKTNFGEEFGMSRFLKKQLDKKYRNERENIESFMNFNKKTRADHAMILDILKKRDDGMKPSVQRILNLRNRHRLEIAEIDLISSYIHMLMNRLFKSKNRLNEMVCYDFLYRYYKTILARN